MRNEEEIKELLDHLRNRENKTLEFEEDAIVAAYQKNNDHQSLAIKILSVFGGLLASIAFLGFLIIAGFYNSGAGLLGFGTICIAGAIFINKEYDKIIIDTVSVSFFIIGFVLLGFGFSELSINEDMVSAIFIIISLCTLYIVRNYILSFISVLIINGSLLTIIISNEGYDLIHVYVSSLALINSYFLLKEAHIITSFKTFSRLYNPVRIGLIFSFLSGLGVLGKKGLVPVSPDYIWVSSVIIISATVYLVSILLDVLKITKGQSKTIVYIFAILVLLSSVLSPSILGALLIILLSFLVNYKTGLILGIISFIYFVSQYYYDLHFTLLTKSILLFASGVLFIVIWLLTHKKLASDEKI